MSDLMTGKDVSALVQRVFSAYEDEPCRVLGYDDRALDEHALRLALRAMGHQANHLTTLPARIGGEGA